MLYVANDISGNSQIRMGPERKARFKAACEARMVGENAALCALVDWWLAQDDVAQAMILGQIKAQPDLVEVVLRRMAAPPPHLQRGHRVGGSRPQVGGA